MSYSCTELLGTPIEQLSLALNQGEGLLLNDVTIEWNLIGLVKEKGQCFLLHTLETHLKVLN